MMNQTNELISTLTIDSNAIINAMDTLRKLCMKGNLAEEANKQVWQAYTTLQSAMIESPEFKAEFGK